MKKSFKKVLALMLAMVMLLGTTTSAQAAPTVYDDPIMDGLQVLQGVSTVLCFYYDYDNNSTCRFDVDVYDSSNTMVATGDDLVPTGDTMTKGLNYIMVPLDTTGYSTGKYTTYFYGEYYSNGSWKSASDNPAKFTFYVVKKNSKLNGLVFEEETAYYYKNGAVDTSFTGFAGGTDPYFYVKNGVMNLEFTGAVYDNASKTWKHVQDGVWANTFTGTSYSESGQYIVFENGVGKEACPTTNGKHEYVNYICKNCGNVAFTDVEYGRFYYDAVLWALQGKITNGTSDTQFSPDRGCTRAEVVTFLWRAAGSPTPIKNENPFNDVPAGKWYTTAVLWAVEQGITDGKSANTFAPDEICTRGQIATFLYRTDKRPLLTPDMKNPFSDVKAGRFYWTPVVWAYYNNVTTGTTATTFSPEDTCTRGQIVTFLYRYYN